jgi:hypothetical protein
VLDIGASTGHWQITDGFPHWTMRNPVRSHAALTPPADPADATGLVSAAGHFTQGCAVRHGTPGERPSPVMQSATPAAPDMSINAREWNDRQLFRILRHGVEYTGMLAWASRNRPDEVRWTVAFVRRLPGMARARYRTLTGAVEDRGVSGCGIGCHGADGARADSATYSCRADSIRALSARLCRGTPPERGDADRRRAAGRRREARGGPVFRGDVGAGDPCTGLGEAKRVIVSGLLDRQLHACASRHGAGKPQPVPAGQCASCIAARLRGWYGPRDVIDARQPQDAMPMIARGIPGD